MMKYVHKIEGAEHFLHFKRGENVQALVTLCDLDDGEWQEVVVATDLVERDGILGVAVVGRDVVLVAHDAHQVSIYRHIAGVESKLSRSMFQYPDSDYRSIHADAGGYNINGSNGDDGKTVLCINLMDVLPKVYGTLGSVFGLHPCQREEPVFCNLYDMLTMYCSMLGENIFIYKRLNFFSEMGTMSNMITLSETPEAKRYFNKFYMLVCNSR